MNEKRAFTQHWPVVVLAAVVVDTNPPPYDLFLKGATDIGGAVKRNPTDAKP